MPQNYDRTMKRRTFLATAVSTTSIAAFAGCLGEGEESSAESSNDNSGSSDNSGGGGSESTQETTQESSSGPEGTINEDDRVSVLEANYNFRTFEGPVVEGQVENTSDTDLTSVNIKVHYFDNEDTRIGESVDMVNDLGAGTSATFETVGGFDVEKGDVGRWELTVEVLDI